MNNTMSYMAYILFYYVRHWFLMPKKGVACIKNIILWKTFLMLKIITY